MGPVFVEAALAIVAVAALGRVCGILILKRRQSRYAKRALAAPRSWRDVCTVPEPYLLGATTLVLWLSQRAPAQPSPAELVRAGAGACLAAVAVALMLWVLRAFPAVSTGHYVLPGHRVVAEGPYALVRHPLYLAAYLVWFAVALGFGSGAALALAVCYVVPGYWIYMRSEEAMLIAHLGDAYREYRERVGMLLPHPSGSKRRSRDGPGRANPA
jgi:protein-S-isoprenylcysteine O-methyltransferase Ste14